MATSKARLRSLSYLVAASSGLLGLAALPTTARAETHFDTRIIHIDHATVLQCVRAGVRADRQVGFKVLYEEATPGLDGIVVGELNPQFKSSLVCTQGAGRVFLVLTVTGPNVQRDVDLAAAVVAAVTGGPAAPVDHAASR